MRLAEADARQCVSSSSLPRDRRDGSDLSTSYVPRGIPASRVFLGLEKPLDKRSMLLSPLVLFFCFSPHVVSSVCVALPALSAGAGLDGHVGVNLQHWVPGFVVVEHGQGAHLLWDAAGLGDPRDDPDGSDYALDGGVVGRPRHLGENQHKSEMKNTLYSV